MRLYISLFIFLVLCGCISPLKAQSKFFKGSQVGVSFGIVKSWRSFTNGNTINSQRSINPLETFSIELIKPLSNKMFVKFNYYLDREEHADLSRTFFHSSYFISAGYRLFFNEINELRPRIGWGVINRASYGTAITEVLGRPDTRNVIHYYSGKEPFANWSIGIDYRHNLTDQIVIGFGMDVTYNFKFKDGRTYFSPTIGFQF